MLLPHSTQTSSSIWVRSHYNKKLPAPPPLLSLDGDLLEWNSGENGKPLPVPPKSARTSTPSKFSEPFFHQINIPQPPKSNEGTPGLSQSWSDSTVEGKSDHLFDSNLVGSIVHKPISLNTTDKSMTVILSTSPPIRSTFTIEYYPLQFSSSSEIWRRRLAKKKHNRVVNKLDLSSSQSRPDLSHRKEELVKQSQNLLHPDQIQSHQRKNHDLFTSKNKLSKSIKRKPVATTALPIPKHSDLMGNKFAKLKNKNLGEFSSISSHHENASQNYKHEPRTISAQLDIARSHISNTLNHSKPSSTLRVYSEKAPSLLRKSSSRRRGNSSTNNFLKPGSNSSTHTSYTYSESNTQAPTLLTPPSSETQTLQSESTLNLLTQPNSQDGTTPKIKILPGRPRSPTPHHSRKVSPTPDCLEKTLSAPESSVKTPSTLHALEKASIIPKSPENTSSLEHVENTLTSSRSPEKNLSFQTPLEKTSSTVTVKLAPAPEINNENLILSGPPLNIVHFDCYHGHRYMRKTRNQICPIGCMVCQKKDTEIRWTCNWCYLSACGDCTRLLNKTPGKNLRLCLDNIEVSKDLSPPFEKNQNGYQTATTIYSPKLPDKGV